jgi:hypothetical protein
VDRSALSAEQIMVIDSFLVQYSIILSPEETLVASTRASLHDSRALLGHDYHETKHPRNYSSVSEDQLQAESELFLGRVVGLEDVMTNMVAETSKLLKTSRSLFKRIKKQENRVMLECYHIAGTSPAENSIRVYSEEVVQVMLPLLTEQVLPKMFPGMDVQNASAYLSIVATVGPLEFQKFHCDNKAADIINIVMPIDDEEYAIDIIQQQEVQRVCLKRGDFLVFSNIYHRGLAFSGLRLHIRIEFGRRGKGSTEVIILVLS